MAAARDFEKYAKELDSAARDWKPTPADALTSLVVMTPTMSEYFGAWKNSRFIAGEAASENAFVAASRLQDIADILGGLVLVYDNVEPLVAKADRQQAKQTKQSLAELRAFAAGLLAEEEAGRKFTAEEADTLGSQAQERAEAIAGQITQAAAQLDIQIETGLRPAKRLLALLTAIVLLAGAAVPCPGGPALAGGAARAGPRLRGPDRASARPGPLRAGAGAPRAG